MNKELVRMEDLILTSCIMFDRFDSMDVSVLKQMISNDFELVVDDMSNKYFIINDGSVIVENSYFNEIESSIDIESLNNIRRSNLYKYLKHINIIEFILRKIKLMNGALPLDELDNVFGSQVELLKHMYKEGYITTYSHKDIIYGDYYALDLTKRGNLYLYAIDNRLKIDKFFNMLIGLGYDKKSFDAFLMTLDFEDNINEILTVSNFMNFYCKYVVTNSNNMKLKRDKK